MTYIYFQVTLSVKWNKYSWYDISPSNKVKSQQSHSSEKSRSRASGHSACLKSILKKITVQGFTLAAITLQGNALDSGHSACLKSMSRTITMQGLTFTAITDSEKCTLMLDLT